MSVTGSEQAEAGPAPELRRALEVFAVLPRVLVALDFDGTLAPHTDDPDRARALPEARRAVARLVAMGGTRVALVSGRAVDDLAAVSGFGDEVLLVGSHGVELRLDDADDVLALNEREQRSMTALQTVLGQVADSLDEVWVEPKPAGYALHTRLASEHHSRVARLEAMNGLQAEVDDLKVRTGKDVVEFSVREATKGEAVEHLRRYTEADGVLYAGDDVTDEDAFRALGRGDFGLKSGDGDTAAAHRVDGPDEVAAVLALLADLRETAAADGGRRG